MNKRCFMKAEAKKFKNKKLKKILFVAFDIIVILVGLYGLFVSLTGGMEYINSPDKRTVNADVISVDHRYEKDDDGDIAREKWTAKLSYTVDGKTYTAKKTFSSKTYSGETVRIEVYKTSKGEYKASGSNGVGVVIFSSVLLIGTVGLITEGKNKKKKKTNNTKQAAKTDKE